MRWKDGRGPLCSKVNRIGQARLQYFSYYGREPESFYGLRSLINAFLGED